MFKLYEKHLKQGPVGLIFAEDTIGLNDTIDHMVTLGFPNIFVLGLPNVLETVKENSAIIDIAFDPDTDNAVVQCLNFANKAFQNRWIFHCFNAEFLYFPFCETRSIGDFISFSDEERRKSIAGVIVDLYTREQNPKSYGYDISNALMDGAGYFSTYSNDADNVENRFVQASGGLRWRHEEFFPWNRRTISRTPMFKTDIELKVNPDFTANLNNYGTIQAPWHRSPTVVVASFRAAKYLRMNLIHEQSLEHFDWAQSITFEHTSAQLMEMGFMEPGQWF